jgi:hypothetical protein
MGRKIKGGTPLLWAGNAIGIIALTPLEQGIPAY